MDAHDPSRPAVNEHRNLVRLVRDLQRRKARERRAQVVAEGHRLVDEALAAGLPVLGLITADDVRGADDTVARARDAGIQVDTVSRAEFDALADTHTPEGVLAVVDWEPLMLERLPEPGPRAVALVLDGVQDPGNAGTMIRTAHALGAWCAIALDGTVDVRNPKVLRGSMGSSFRLPVAEADFEACVPFLRAKGCEIILAAMDGVPSYGLRAAGPLALVIGSEGRGVRQAWEAQPLRRIAIPMPGGSESLNAGVAAGILLYEALRAGR